LKGLNSFITAKSQILFMEPLPSIGKVYSLVLQQEICYFDSRIIVHCFLLFCYQPKP